MPEQLCGSGCSDTIPERVLNDVQGLGGGLERFGGSGAVWGKSASGMSQNPSKDCGTVGSEQMCGAWEGVWRRLGGLGAV